MGEVLPIVTDHKPLTSIVGLKTRIPNMAAAGLPRWALLLSTYNYSNEFKSTQDHSNTDRFSGLPLGRRQPSSIMIEQI